MSRKLNPYVFYTEYYLISGAYQVINIVNGILTYSASCSDNIKEYLRNQVASKQVALNELIRNKNENNTKINTNQNDSDIDEDGFVVIKMRRPKNKIKTDTVRSSSYTPLNTLNVNKYDCDSLNSYENENRKNEYDLVVKEIVECLINDVIKRYTDQFDQMK